MAKQRESTKEAEREHNPQLRKRQNEQQQKSVQSLYKGQTKTDSQHSKRVQVGDRKHHTGRAATRFEHEKGRAEEAEQHNSEN